MSLNYDKVVSKKHDGDNFWASYADLYTMLSVVFLMMYVTASLRSGTSAVQKEQEFKKIAAEAADLKAQNEVYSALKDDYLEKKASQHEQEVYKELMKKLSLLQDEAKKEKEELRAQAAENEKKEMALNQYQQIIRNIINANMLAKSSIKSRDEVIETKKKTIASLDQKVTEQSEIIQMTRAEIQEKSETLRSQEQELLRQQRELKSRNEEVDSLKDQVEEKKQQISSNKSQIDAMNQELAQKIEELKKTQTTAKTSKQKLLAAIKKAQQETAAKVQALESKNRQAEEQLDATAEELNKAKGALSAAEQSLAAQEAEKERLAKELEDTSSRLAGEMEAMKKGFEQEMASKEKAFQDDLNKQKLTAAQRAAKEKAFKDAAEQKAKELEGELSKLGDQIKEAEDKLKKAGDAEKKHKDYIAALEKEKRELADDLKKSKDQLRDQRKIAKAIKDAFNKAGIKASVDPKSGDVTVNFQEYFDTGRSDLKDSMVKDLRKLIPVYAASLLGNDDVASKISSIDIIGFASPTYKGKYVDPESLLLEDRDAVQYNLDLSYNRAKSIFAYVFDTDKMRFKHQKELLPLVKVTGRSYLAEGAKGRDARQGLSVKEYCSKYDCLKDQKVIIKFNLKD